MHLQDFHKQADSVFLPIAIGIKGKCPQYDSMTEHGFGYR